MDKKKRVADFLYRVLEKVGLQLQKFFSLLRWHKMGRETKKGQFAFTGKCNMG